MQILSAPGGLVYLWANAVNGDESISDAAGVQLYVASVDVNSEDIGAILSGLINGAVVIATTSDNTIFRIWQKNGAFPPSASGSGYLFTVAELYSGGTPAENATMSVSIVYPDSSVAYPGVQEVLDGVAFGDNGSLTGVYETTGIQDVRENVTFGANGSLTGVLTLPPVGDVEVGVLYGANATEFNGTLEGIFGAEDKTRLQAIFDKLPSANYLTGTANSNGSIASVGSVTGNVVGNVNGTILGHVGGNVNGSLAGNVNGSIGGSVSGNVNGSLLGHVGGNVNGSVAGSVGSVTGNVGGHLAGNVNGTIGGLSTQAKADVNAEADTALADVGLNSTVIGRIDVAISTRGTGTALDAAGVRSAVGLASANLDTQIGTLATAANLATVAGYLDTEIAAILADTNELQTDWTNGGRLDLLLDSVIASLAALNDLSAAEVNAEVVDALATDTYAEPTAVPAATASLKDKIGWICALARNKIVQTSTTQTVYRDDGSTTLATSTHADNGTSHTRGEFS